MNTTTDITSLRVIFQLATNPEVAGDIVQSQNGSFLNLEGSYAKIVWDIRDALNLDLKIIFETDLSWETPIKRLTNGEADLCAMSISQSLYYKDLGLDSSFVFLHAIISEKRGLFFRQPFYKHYPSMLLRPFQWDLWMAVLTVIAISTTLTCLKLRFSHSSNFNKVATEYSDIFIYRVGFVLGRVCRSSEALPEKYSLSILCSLLLATLMINVYTAEIISTFSNDDGRLVKYPNDLITLGYTFSFWYDYRIDRMYPESMHSKLEKQPSVIIKGWGQFVEMMMKIVSPTEKGKYAVILDHVNEFFLSKANPAFFARDKCSVASFPSPIKYPKSMLLRKDSPLRDSINVKLLQLNERGLKFRYHLTYLNKLQSKCVQKGADYVMISIRHVSIAYFVLIFGVITSLAVEIYARLRERIFVTQNGLRLSFIL